MYPIFRARSRRHAGEWIIGLEEVTGLAQAEKAAMANRRRRPSPGERIYDVPADIRERLAMD